LEGPAGDQGPLYYFLALLLWSGGAVGMQLCVLQVASSDCILCHQGIQWSGSSNTGPFQNPKKEYISHGSGNHANTLTLNTFEF